MPGTDRQAGPPPKRLHLQCTLSERKRGDCTKGNLQSDELGHPFAPPFPATSCDGEETVRTAAEAHCQAGAATPLFISCYFYRDPLCQLERRMFT